MLFVIPIVALLCAVSFRLILGRARFVPEEGGKAEAGRISIIIPARNEEAKLGGLLSSIEGQAAVPLEVIVVDDGSEDRTAALARGNGAKVVESAPLPEGWKGKPWACQQGAAAAGGDWLLFLDADTRLEAGGMARLAALTAEAGRVYSVCPYHHVRGAVEELSAFLNVLMVTGVSAFGWRSGRGEALFGQCMLISREHYEAVGGHGAVRGEVLENFHLAAHWEELGIGRRCFLGRGVVRMRMFGGGLGELWRSWKKGFARGAKGVAPRALVCSSVWITGAMFALVGVLVACLPMVTAEYRVAAGLAYAVYVVQCWWAFRLVGTFSVCNAVLFPVSLLFYQVLFFTSVLAGKRGKTTEWKGRDVG